MDRSRDGCRDGLLAPPPKSSRPSSPAWRSASVQRLRSNIFQRDQAERDQPLGIITAILSRPIVVCPEAGGTQFDIVETIERHAHRGIDNFGPHAIEVLVLYPCGRIPNALRRSIKSLLVVLRQIFRFDAGAEERRDRDRINLLADEELAILAILAAHRMWRAIAELLIDSLGPYGWRFNKV